MDCAQIEGRLSEYLERELPSEGMAEVARHVHECGACASLLEDMKTLLANCKTFPVLDVDTALLDRILLRTTGRPHSRTIQELLQQYFLGPVLTPRFAAGAGLLALFFAFSANLIMPRVSEVAESLSPRTVFRQLDRGAQQIYGEGLKLYDKKNELQAQFTFLKNNVLNKLGFMIEQLDVPMEGKQESEEPSKDQEDVPGQKSSVLLLTAEGRNRRIEART